MRAAIAAEAARLNALDDDLETVRATDQVFNALDDAILAIGEPRLRELVPRPETLPARVPALGHCLHHRPDLPHGVRSSR
ncbi:hypothetical protein [Nocardioides mesophilus]|uniref:Uncharacterized protein n=1 Tax=Nocardioides mesophilus TaxID=433659 RepID=A0A7G9R700_9ACTN|nr:hypothetical protein [Nocardioides mesophilus]QNN51375.1 hypothetical protein H9L09_12205 [Nocardioides mesophilus]